MRTAPILKRHWGGLVVILLLAAAAWHLVRSHEGELNRETILAYGMGLPSALVIAAFLVLPLVGFPVSVLLVLIGLRFGIAWGMVIVTLGMLFHHLVVFGITRGRLSESLNRRMTAFGYGIPPIKEGHRLWFTALFAAIHGPPYTAKLYLLALTDLPFRYYCWVGLPVYVAFSLIPVSAGKAVMDLNAMTLTAILAAAVAMLVLAHRLTRKYKAAVGGLPGDGI